MQPKQIVNLSSRAVHKLKHYKVYTELQMYSLVLNTCWIRDEFDYGRSLHLAAPLVGGYMCVWGRARV